MAARNTDVGSMNHELLDNMNGDKDGYPSADSIEAAPGTSTHELASIPPELLRVMEESGLPPWYSLR